MKKVAVVMGSDSDLPIVKKAADTLKSFGVMYKYNMILCCIYINNISNNNNTY